MDIKVLKFDDLVRIGRNGDGGYVIKRSLIQESDFLLTFGINDDWSFEKMFIKIAKINCKCIAFDYSIHRLTFLMDSILQFKYLIGDFFKSRPIKLDRIKNSFDQLINFFKFNMFFLRHSFFSVGVDSHTHHNFKKFDHIFSELGLIEKKVFLKIDIETMEYNIYQDVLKFSKNIIAITIEIHEIHKNLNRFKEMITMFEAKYTLYHFHENNYAPVELKDGFPDVLELSFISNDLVVENFFYSDLKDFPIVGLDQLNDSFGPQIIW